MNSLIYLPTIIQEPNETKFIILEGQVFEELNEETVIVEFKFPDGTKGRQEYLVENICTDKISAEKKLFDLKIGLQNKRIREEFPVHLIPEKIGKTDEGYFSGNPLRCGEPNISYSAQSNTFGDTENPQKIIQTIAAIDEDLEVLFNLFDLIYLTNDYTKKLLGKYCIIELNSFFLQLKKLASIDKNYSDNFFPELAKEIKELEDKYGFKVIRDKYAAHRDTNVDLMHAVDNWRKITRFNIYQYLIVLQSHLDKFLTNHYPMEKKSYFLIRKSPIGRKMRTPGEDNYVPFDEHIFNKPIE